MISSCVSPCVRVECRVEKREEEYSCNSESRRDPGLPSKGEDEGHPTGQLNRLPDLQEALKPLDCSLCADVRLFCESEFVFFTQHIRATFSSP
jgi:hypothetical protein